MAVVPEAIGLRDQVAGTPEEVDLVWAYSRIDFWLGKPVTAAEAQEHALELAAGEVWVGSEIAG